MLYNIKYLFLEQIRHSFFQYFECVIEPFLTFFRNFLPGEKMSGASYNWPGFSKHYQPQHAYSPYSYPPTPPDDSHSLHPQLHQQQQLQQDQQHQQQQSMSASPMPNSSMQHHQSNNNTEVRSE